LLLLTFYNDLQGILPLTTLGAPVLISPFQYPAWATPGEKRKKFGKAKALGAAEITLQDEDETEGFLEASKPYFNLLLI
jgi:hypothetical protein